MAAFYALNRYRTGIPFAASVRPAASSGRGGGLVVAGSIGKVSTTFTLAGHSDGGYAKLELSFDSSSSPGEAAQLAWERAENTIRLAEHFASSYQSIARGDGLEMLGVRAVGREIATFVRKSVEQFGHEIAASYFRHTSVPLDRLGITSSRKVTYTLEYHVGSFGLRFKSASVGFVNALSVSIKDIPGFLVLERYEPSGSYSKAISMTLSKGK